MRHHKYEISLSLSVMGMRVAGGNPFQSLSSSPLPFYLVVVVEHLARYIPPLFLMCQLRLNPRQLCPACAHTFLIPSTFSIFSIRSDSILWLRFYPKVSLEPKPTTLHSLPIFKQTDKTTKKTKKQSHTTPPHGKKKSSSL